MQKKFLYQENQTQMISLNQILKDILLSEDVVVIPGLGAFETTYQPAQLNEKTGIIYPPTKKVSFNPDKKTDNKEIIKNFLVNDLKISEQEAIESINNFVNSINEKMAQKANVVIDEVGILFSEDGKIGLKSIPSNLLIDNYGMQSSEVVKVDESKREQTAKPKVAAVTTTTTKKTTTTTTTTTTSSKKSDKKPEEPQKSGKSSSIKNLIIILIILAILTALALIFKDKIIGLFKKDKQEAPKVEVVENNNTSDDNIDDILSSTQEVEPSLSDDEILSNVGLNHITPLYIGNQYQKYYLIAGAFKNKYGANKRIAELKEKGLTAEILNVGEMYRVYVANSDSAQEIAQEYVKFKEKIPGNDYWLLLNSK